MLKKLAFFVPLLILLLFPAHAVAKAPDTNDVSEILNATAEESVDFGKIFDVIRDTVADCRTAFLRSVFVMLAIVLLSSVFTSYGGSGALGNALSYTSVLALSGCAFSILTSVFSYAADSIAAQCRYMTAFLPVAASLCSLGGNIVSGVAGSSALLAFLSVASNISDTLLIPLMQGGFVLTLSSALPFCIPFRSVMGFVKNTVTTLLAFIFSIFGMVMYLQSVITASTDSFAFRTVKFASGAFIPVIGGMLGDAARTVAASAAVVRATVGGAGIIALLCITLPAVIYTLFYKLGMLLCAMVSRALGCERESRLLYDINSLLSVLLAIELGVAVMFVIAVALFIRIGVNV